MPTGSPSFPGPRPAPVAGAWAERLVAVGVALGLAAGGLAWAFGRGGLSDLCWALTTGLALVPLVWSAGRELLKGRTGVDAIALLAMVGALLLGEYLAGAVIALMLSGGAWLESLADRRARRELALLVERQPRSVERYEGETLVTRPVEEIAPGDAFLVRPGEVVALDGVVEGERAVLDTSALTGEARPVVLEPGEKVDSGAVNAGAPLRIRATATAAASTYAGIVRLVEEAQATRAPMVRLADRYAAIFLPVTLAVAGGAWALTGDPVRALAVLVVATPCPLILATPIALMGGISRAAKLGVVVKGGGALEALARAGQLFLDKTGTVTRGRPVLVESRPFGALGPLEAGELLRLAASLDLVSPHVLAAAIVSAARERGLELAFPEEPKEEYGYGIAGRVDGRAVRLGQGEWIRGDRPFPPEARAIRRRSMLEGLSMVLVEVDGEIAGALLLQDPLRPEAPRSIRRLRDLGFESVTLLTGDHLELARIVGNALGVDQVLAERSPVEKVEAVRQAAAEGAVVMVGDGINDAAALAVADVGIAMSARGASVSSEAADAVVVADRFDRVADATRVARRSRRIALQSIGVGMALSGVGMGFAAAGVLAPVLGALVQEAIDVASILNALRALWGGGGEVRASPALARVRTEIHEEHEKLRPELESLRRLADRLDGLPGDEARTELGRALGFLEQDILAHHREEDERLYPELTRVLGDGKSLEPMGRTHQEIEHLVRYFARILDETGAEGPDAEDRRELRRLLYGLAAVLEVHFGEEETLVDAYDAGGIAPA